MLIAVLTNAIPPLPVQNVGWTWGATMGLLTNLLIGGAGVGVIGAILRFTVELKRVAVSRQQQEDARDGVRWQELTSFNEILQRRVDRVEGDLREERKRCEAEIKGLHDRIEGLQRAMFQNAASLGNMVKFPPNAPTTAANMQGKKK